MTTSTSDAEFGRYVSPAEAARIIGISKQSVANLIRRGYFKTKAIAGRVLILRSEAEGFEPRPKGRPLKKLSRNKMPHNSPPVSLRMKSAKDYVTQAEAARIRGVSQQAIANLIRRGRLDSISVAGRTLVLRSVVENFVPKPNAGGSLKKRQGRRR